MFFFPSIYTRLPARGVLSLANGVLDLYLFNVVVGTIQYIWIQIWETWVDEMKIQQML
jgi:hypothetical protein